MNVLYPVTLLGLALSGSLPSPHPDDGAFRAGAAAVDVTPGQFPVIVSGMFLSRKADRAHDRLKSRALVLDDGKVRLAVVVVDSLMIRRDLLDVVKEKAAVATGIPAGRILISATHTHSAPSVMGALGTPADEAYRAWLPGRIVQSIVEADRNLAPARIGWAVVRDEAHNHCRRWIFRADRMGQDPFGRRNVRAMMHPGHESPNHVGPAGPADQDLSVVSVRSPEGRPIAVLANYAMHYKGSPMVSGDFCGRFGPALARLLKSEKSDPPFVGIMSQGTSGDSMWMDYSKPRSDPGLDGYTRAVAGLVADAIGRIEHRDRATLAMAETTLKLRRRTPDAARLEWAKGVAGSMKGRLPRNRPEVYALEAIHLHEKPEVEIKLQAIRIGDLGITAIPNEVYGITGLKLKAWSPLAPTFNVELANGAQGYIPPPEQHALGGYTTWPARTAGLEVEAEPKIVETLLSLLERVSGKKRRERAVPRDAYLRAVLESKPDALWPLDEMAGTTAKDISGHGRDGRYAPGVALFLPGRAGSSRSVHFAGGRMEAEVSIEGNAWTVEGWLWNGRPEAKGRVISMEPSGLALSLTDLPIAPRTWNHFALTGNGRLYLNGAALKEIAADAAGKVRLALGGLEGRLDDVAFHSRALPAAEVAAHFKAAGIRHSRKPRPDLRRYADAVRASRPVASWAQVSGRMKAEAKGLGNRYSVEMWIWNEMPVTARPVTGYFFSRGKDGAKEAPGDHFGIGGTAIAPGRLIVFNGNARNEVLEGKTRLNLRSWTHVVMARDGKTVRVHLNGEPKPEIEGDLVPTYAPDGVDLFVGGRNDGFAPFRGRIDHAALYDRPLSSEEVAAHFAASGIVPSEPQEPRPDPPPRSPEESRKTIHVREGYEVELVAAEPMVVDPVAIDWGVDGKLWVAEMADYPMGIDGKGKPGGRVRFLEDTDGDGRYDRSTLFLEGLSFPTGVMAWRKGVLVTAAPELLYAEDTDGDGKADRRETLITGFVEGNQQLRVNGLRWGLDNWVYCASGGHHGGFGAKNSVTEVKTGRKVALGSRDFRIRPDEGTLDPQSGPAQFGRSRDDWGNWFGQQNSRPLWHYVLADPYLRRNAKLAPPDPRRMLRPPTNPRVYPVKKPQKRYHSFEHSTRYTSACSAMIYRDALLFPRGDVTHAFTCEPFHGLVQHHVLREDGVSFTGARGDDGEIDFFASRDRWCRPVMARTGPDGALWVADLYRYVIEHPQFLTPQGKEELRPFYRLGDDRGRIWRVFPKGRRPSLVHRIEGRASALETSNGVVRDKVQQMIVWRGGTEAVGPLERLFAESGDPRTRLAALCTLDGLGALKPALVRKALSDPHPGVRRHAVRLAEPHEELAGAAAKLVGDPDAKVRLQLACSLGEWNEPRALGRLIAKDGADPYLAAAALSSVRADTVDEVIAAVSKEGGLSAGLVRLAASHGRYGAVGDALVRPTKADAGAYSVPFVDSVGELLEELRRRRIPLEKLGEQAGAAVASVREFARKMARDPKAAERLRMASVRVLEPEDLAPLLSPQTPSAIQSAIVRRLSLERDASVATILLEGWESRGPALRSEILSVLITRSAWIGSLVGALEAGRVSERDLGAGIRRSLERQKDKKLRDRLKRVLTRSVSDDRRKVIDRFRPALKLKPNPANGEALFRKLCAACHKHRTLGREVGPTLAALTDKRPESLLVSILDPSRSMDPRYVSYRVRTRDGRVLSGMLASESGAAVTLVDVTGKSHSILRSDVERMKGSGESLMPIGLEKGLTPQDLADLIGWVTGE